MVFVPRTLQSRTWGKYTAHHDKLGSAHCYPKKQAHRSHNFGMGPLAHIHKCTSLSALPAVDGADDFVKGDGFAGGRMGVYHGRPPSLRTACTSGPLLVVHQLQIADESTYRR